MHLTLFPPSYFLLPTWIKSFLQINSVDIFSLLRQRPRYPFLLTRARCPYTWSIFCQRTVHFIHWNKKRMAGKKLMVNFPVGFYSPVIRNFPLWFSSHSFFFPSERKSRLFQSAALWLSLSPLFLSVSFSFVLWILSNWTQNCLCTLSKFDKDIGGHFKPTSRVLQITNVDIFCNLGGCRCFA